MPHYTNLSQGNTFWVDLGSPDIAASMSFYAQLFGWSYEEAPEGVAGRRYAWAKIPAGLTAGIYSEDGAEGGSGVGQRWNVHILVDDIDEATGRPEEFGGSISSPRSKVGDYGISAVIADPTGGTVNIWQEIQSGPTIKHEHGAMQWCEFMTTDAAAFSAFFRTLFRVKTEATEMPDGSSNSLSFPTEGDGPVMGISALGGLSDELIARLGGPTWTVYFNVYDVDAAVDRAVQHGAELPDPPWDVPA